MSAIGRNLPGHDWPLTGRDDELTQTRVALEASDSAAVVLAGAPGVGKTRLLREILDRAGHGDYIAATRAAASVPFGALSHLVAGIPRTAGLELWHQVADQLAARASGPGFILGVDDAHLLDEPSAALLHQLVVHGRVSVAATIRADEPAPDAVTALWKDGLAQRITIRPLPAPAVEQLIGHVLGPHVEGRTRRHIRDITAGNPLLLRELLNGALEEKALVQSYEVWHWVTGPRYGPCLIQLVEQRLAGLSEAARSALEVIACGEPVAAAVLGDLADGGMLEPRAVAEVDRAGLIARERSGRRELLLPAHPLYGAVVRALVPLDRARRIWGWLAAAAQPRPARRHDDKLRVASWRLDAGTAQDRTEQIAAADQAMFAGDLSMAERFIRAAGSAAPRFALARVLTWQGRHAEALVALEDGRGEWAVMRAWNWYWSGGGLSTALAAIGPAFADSRSVADGTRAWLLLFSGQCARALDAVSSASADSARFTLAAAALARALAGRPGMAIRCSAGRNRVMLGWPECLALLLRGAVAEARTLAEDGYDEAVEREVDTGVTAVWAVCRGKAALAQGQLAPAEVAFREAAMLLDERDNYQFSRYVLAELASVFAHAGDASAAREWMNRSDARRCPANRLFEPWVELKRAWVMAAEGDLSAAAGQACRAAGLARAAGQHAVEAEALYDSVRFGSSWTATVRLAELAPELNGALGTVLSDAAQAFASQDGHRLDSVADAFGRIGLLLHAAEAAGAATRSHQVGGRAALASASRRQLTLLIEACPDARTPLLRIAGAETTPALTRREQQIALMASSGLSSRDIAAKLNLSVRTIGNHLGHAYAKLGISGRNELASSFERGGR
ncbi:MAG: LuxR C-terminal-related transcriptional regulator [Streptosporangiaceae bacterium]|jgi:DNA-binding CsgD family transcriptional regulator